MLWQTGMDDFEIIFGLKFEDVILGINGFLNNKYPDTINFDWVKFRQKKAYTPEAKETLMLVNLIWA